MKIIKLVILFVFFTFFSAFSQNDKVAQDILNGLSAKYKSLKSLKASFSIVIENQQDKSKQVQNGTYVELPARQRLVRHL